MAYDIKEHKHRFSIWTSARAQRSFVSTRLISSVINNTSLREFAESGNNFDCNSYDDQHRKWCREILSEFKKKGITTSYGRAAKIIAIYLKTSVIIGNNMNPDLNNFIHPPIDSMILKSFSGDAKFKDFKSKKWTKFDEGSYWEVVERIREKCGSFNWKIESQWHPEQ